MRLPIRDAYTVPYGAAFGAVRAGGARTHQGWDLHAPEGTPIFAGQRGKVIARGYTSGYGNYADIIYPGSIHIRYAHMQFPAALRQYQSWDIGEPQLGLVGKTGSAAYGDPPGAHLHVEVRVLGSLTDPAKFFTTPALAGSTGIEIEMVTQADIDKIATAVWSAGFGRDENRRTAGAILVDTANIPLKTWQQPVNRGGEAVPALQELADTKTNTLGLVASNKALAAALSTLATANGLDPVALRDSIAEAVELALQDDFAAVNANINDQPTTFKITPA